MSRHLAVGHPDGSATAWRLVSESRWKQPVVSPSTGEPDPVEWPTAAIDRLLEIVAGKRIAAFDPKKTTRYLRRLGKIAGRGAIPPIEDYVDIAEGLGMNAMHFRTLMETIEGPCLAKDFRDGRAARVLLSPDDGSAAAWTRASRAAAVEPIAGAEDCSDGADRRTGACTGKGSGWVRDPLPERYAVTFEDGSGPSDAHLDPWCAPPVDGGETLPFDFSLRHPRTGGLGWLVSTEVEELDFDAGSARTPSGRRYQLGGRFDAVDVGGEGDEAGTVFRYLLEGDFDGFGALRALDKLWLVSCKASRHLGLQHPRAGRRMSEPFESHRAAYLAAVNARRTP